MREAFASDAGQDFLAALQARRPEISEKTWAVAEGYERCMAIMAALLSDRIGPPEVRSVDIATD